MDFDIDEAQIARAMVEQSETLTELADSSKLGALASFEVCPLTAIDPAPAILPVCRSRSEPPWAEPVSRIDVSSSGCGEGAVDGA